MASSTASKTPTSSTASKTPLVLPILPIEGVPEELVRVLNDRFRSLRVPVEPGGAGTVVKGTPGPPGGQGPPGTPGTGTGPGSPNVLSTSTASVFYASSGNTPVFGFQGQIDLPTTDPNFAGHFKRVDVLGVDPSGGAHLVQSFTGSAITGTSIAYSGAIGPQPPTNEIWSVAFQCYDELGAPTASPYTIPGLAVRAAAVTAVSGAEVPGSHFQDRLQGLHVEIDLTVTTANLQPPVTVTFWLDVADGNGWVWQGPHLITAATGTVRLGEQKPGPDMTGDIWVPPPGRDTWKVAAAVGNISKTSTLPSGAITNTFHVTPVGTCSTTDITDAQFVPNPVTGDILTYILHNPGMYNWGYYQLQYTQPTIGFDPWYWFSFISIQKGHTTTGTCTIASGISLTVTAGPTLSSADVGKLIYIAGGLERTIVSVTSSTQATLSATTTNGAGQSFEIWNPSPITPTDDEGIDQHPELYHGRWHAVSASFQGGVTSTPGSSVTYVGAKPPDWTFPLLKNPDGTTNINRQFRCWLYCGSHLNDLLPDGTWPAVPFVLQAAWAGKDHFDLAPAAQPAALDLTVANPTTIALPLAGGNGLPLTVSANSITDPYIATAAITARAMAQNSITALNLALAAGAVVDSNVHDVNISKFTAGINVFTGDVVLSRGISLPVLVLQNTGLSLFGQANAVDGKTGLPTKPYVQVQSTGVKLNTGGGASTLLDAGTNTIFLYSVDGNVSFPYVSVATNGLTMVNGPNSVAINTNAMSFTDTQFHNQLTMNSAGLTVANTSSNNKLVITATDIQLQEGGVAKVTINSTTGITLSNGGTSSVTIDSSSVRIVNGSMTSPVINGGSITGTSLSIGTVQGTVNISNSTSGIEILGSPATNLSRVTPSVIAIYAGSIGSEMSPTTLLVGRFGTSPILPIGLNANNGTMVIGAKTVIDANQIWREGVQCADHIIGNDFGITNVSFGWPQTASSGSPVPPGGYGPGAAQGVTQTFATGAGQTVYVCGGLIVNVV